jgi:hypothetical protein
MPLHSHKNPSQHGSCTERDQRPSGQADKDSPSRGQTCSWARLPCLVMPTFPILHLEGRLLVLTMAGQSAPQSAVKKAETKDDCWVGLRVHSMAAWWADLKAPMMAEKRAVQRAQNSAGWMVGSMVSKWAA